VSRLDRNSVPVYPEVIDLETFLEETAATISDAERVGVEVTPAGAKIETDPDHLGRILINLVENAVKYAPGSPIEVRAAAGRLEVEISVIDHGDGIPADMTDRVFERFTQLERSDTRTKGGTGLGLSIVRGLAEALGGTVAHTPTPGGGATFTVTLPLRCPTGTRD